MLRNKFHVYGNENIRVPFHLHAGKDILDKILEYGDHPALINAETGETMTYKQLAEQTVDIALSLTRIGVGKGDVVSICSEKRMEVIPTILGVFCAGATFGSTNINYGPESFIYRVKILKTKIMFCSPTGYDQHKKTLESLDCIKKYIVYGNENKDGGVLFKEFLSETSNVKEFLPIPVDGWKDIVLILFSSGTTGLPKAVPWTHLGLITNTVYLPYSASNFIDSCDHSIFISREWYHLYSIYFIIISLKNKITVVYSGKNEYEECLQAIEKYKITILQSAPSAISELIKSDILGRYDLTSLKAIVSSSSPVLSAQVALAKKRLPNLDGVFQMYGSSEAGNICSELHAPFGPRDGSVGTPSNAAVLKVVDLDTHQPLGPNQRGEIYIKSPSLFREYLCIDNSKLEYLDEEGFYKSGDMGYYDEDKYFYVINRLKEVIKYKDLSIPPAEVESLLLRHPSVRDAGVIGAPHAGCGELPVAFVVLQPGCHVTKDDLMDIIARYRLQLASEVRFVEKLPRLGGIKLDRQALKLML